MAALDQLTLAELEDLAAKLRHAIARIQTILGWKMLNSWT
jgi:hypothetical protein